MYCYKCKEYEWDAPQPIFIHEEQGTGVCIFHANIAEKLVSIDEFNGKLLAYIKNTVGSCNLTGIIFPGPVEFSKYKRYIGAQTIDMSGSEFHGIADFSNFNVHGSLNISNVKFYSSVIFDGVVIESKAIVQNVLFSGTVSFEKVKVRESAVFDYSIFLGNATFVEFTSHAISFQFCEFKNDVTFRGTQCKSKSTFANTKFSGQSRFISSIFNGEFDISNVQFLRLAIFSKSTFGLLNLSNSIFEELAYFYNVTFVGETKFSFVKFLDDAEFIECNCLKPLLFSYTKAKDDAIHITKFDSSSVYNINFTSTQTRSFSFRGCLWPDSLAIEQSTPLDLKACEELYRSLKQKAAAEHDQPMTSWWHYREKLMKLAGVKIKYPLIWRVHWLGLYWRLCGFGEQWVPPLKALGGMLLFCLFLLGLGGVHVSGFVIQGLDMIGTRAGAWEGTQRLGLVFLTLLKYLLLVKDDTSSFRPIYAWAEFLILLFTRLLIPIQAAFFVIALRNAYRR